MNKFLVRSLAIAAMTLATAAFAAATQGDTAPTFTAQASKAGKTLSFSLADALKSGPVVVYFYPSAYTGGCDIEAHTFAEDAEKFKAAGATIIGVSADSIDRLNTFSADPNYCAGKFAVASDPGGKIAASYGLKVTAADPTAKDERGVTIDHGFIERTTFVIGRDGKIAAVFSSEADHLHPKDHVAKSLTMVEQMKNPKAP
jgi:peroxiredoxin